MKELLAQALKSEPYNTNNDWGFGGGIGTQYTFKNDVVVKIGTACYRHIPSQSYATVTVDGKRIIDVPRFKETDIAQIKKLIA